jgi:hypothetical protein
MNKILLLDENRGVYIPMQFGIIYGDDVWNIDKELLKELHIDSPVYWEAWEEVLEKAVVQIDGVSYKLHQDGDLWAIPAGYEAID